MTADATYIAARFRPQTETERERASAGLGPAATYVLDGVGYTSLRVDAELAAAVDPRPVFRRRFLAAGGEPAEVDEELGGWLSGAFGMCLPVPAPEAIVAKTALAHAIDALSASPAAEEAWWTGALRAAVDAYDALVMPFAPGDPERIGALTSRQRLVDATHARWPQLWNAQAAAGLSHGESRYRAGRPVPDPIRRVPVHAARDDAREGRLDRG